MNAERFGKYVLLQSLAKGGMGEVFLARAGQRGFERLFAIKRILTQHEGTESFSKGLMDEARISIRLQHPNITQVFEFGQEGESFFLVMEYIEGMSLSALLQAGRKADTRMTTADALSIARDLCRALDYAHRKTEVDGTPLGIVHRDISPHNVLIDESGTVKLIDFGIAKASQNNVITEAGALKGKIPYMAPEQAGGKDVDHRLDLYAVGAVLYECLAYERLFPRGESMALLAKIIKGEFPNFQENIPGLPREVYEILARSVTRDMKFRYPDAATMEADVARALSIISPTYTPRSLANHMEKVEHKRQRRKQAIASYMSADSIAAVEAGALTRQLTPSGTEIPRVEGVPTGASPAGTPFTDVGIDITMTTPPPLQRTVASDPMFLSVEQDGKPARARAPGDSSRRVPIAAALVGVLALTAFAWWALDSDGEPDDVVWGADIGVPEGETVESPEEPPPEDKPAKVDEAPADALVNSDVAQRASEPEPPAATKKTAQTARTRKKRGRRGGDETPHAKAPPKRERAKPRVAAKKGCVIVGAEPWADVYVGGKKRGTTPLVCLSLPEGVHTLTLKNPALGKEQKKRVTVSAAKKSKVFVKF